MTRVLRLLGLALLMAAFAAASQKPEDKKKPPSPEKAVQEAIKEAQQKTEEQQKEKAKETPPKPEPQPGTEGMQEEDESQTTKEYSFNPLQADKEIRVGDFYAKKKSWRAASQRYDEATKWNPGLADAFLKLGRAKEKMGDADGAKEAFLKYIELSPTTKEAEELKAKYKK